MSTWDDKPNDYEAALAEIDRLLEQLALAETRIDIWDAEAEERRVETIEECARVAVAYNGSPAETPWDAANAIAAAIRALKDKA